MKTRSTISNNILQLALGLLVAIFVISQTVYIEPVVPDNQEQSENETPENVLVVTSEAVTSPSLQVNLGFQSYLLGEITQTESDQKETFSYNRLLPTVSKALKVLFSRIIAPNAP